MAITITIKSAEKVENWLAEAREIYRALDSSADISDGDLIKQLMLIGLGHLRAAKCSRDATVAAQTMHTVIHDPQTPRPSREKAGLN